MIHVKILSTQGNDEFDAKSHEIMGLPAGTYHKFTMPNGNIIYHNDFGIKTLVISHAQAPERR